MGRINVARVIIGGLVAGVVINISESVLNLWALGQATADAMKAHNLPEFRHARPRYRLMFTVGNCGLSRSGAATFTIPTVFDDANAFQMNSKLKNVCEK